MRRTMAKHSDEAHYDSLLSSGLVARGNVESIALKTDGMYFNLSLYLRLRPS